MAVPWNKSAYQYADELEDQIAYLRKQLAAKEAECEALRKQSAELAAECVASMAVIADERLRAEKAEAECEALRVERAYFGKLHSEEYERQSARAKAAEAKLARVEKAYADLCSTITESYLSE